MNLPNKITLTRIFLIPIMVFFYLANFIPYGKLVALIIFVVAAATDFLDGKIARKYNMVTNLGKFLDPIADKVLLLSGLLLVVCDGTILIPYGLIAAIIMLSRELIISAFRQIAASKNVIMAADIWGKYKAFAQDILIAVYMFLAFLSAENLFGQTVQDVFQYVGLGVLAVSVALTIISGVNYVVKNKQVLKDSNK